MFIIIPPEGEFHCDLSLITLKDIISYFIIYIIMLLPVYKTMCFFVGINAWGVFGVSCIVNIFISIFLFYIYLWLNEK